MAEASEVRSQPAGQAALDLGGLRAKKPRSLWSDAWRQFRKHHLAVAGVFVLVFLTIATLIGPLVWPNDMSLINFSESTQGVSLDHPMGTDDLGRDIFARILWGGRISLAVGVAAMMVAILLGTMIGAIAGFFGGFTDSLLMRFTDMFISLPSLPLLLLTIYLFRDTLRDKIGPNLGPFVLIVALIGVTNWMPVARLVRASFLSVKEKEFIEAAYCIGASRSSIIFRHILPNVLGVIIVSATLAIAAAILLETALSYLGFGVKAPDTSLGALISQYQSAFLTRPWLFWWPGLFIVTIALAVNFIGDGLRDAYDPRQTRVRA